MQIPYARVLLYGYNANIAFEASVYGVREHATNLIGYLDAKRRVRSHLQLPL